MPQIFQPVSPNGSSYTFSLGSSEDAFRVNTMSALEAARKGRKESVQSEAGAQTTEERIRSLGLTCGTLQSSLWVEETDVPAPCR